MVRHFLKFGLAMGILAAASGNAAEFALWTTNSDPSSYVLHNNNTGLYVETINCRAAFTFQLKKVYVGGIQLYDASRDLYVLLDQFQMKLWSKAERKWVAFKSGTFDNRYLFEHQDTSGAITGSLWKKDACVWEEYGGGTSQPDFRFRQTRVSDGTVVLHDASRAMWAMLGEETMYLHQGSAPNSTNWHFFKKGHWAR